MSSRVGLTGAEAAQLVVVLASAWAGSLLPAPSTLDPSARPWPATLAVMLLGLFLVAAQRRWPTSFDAARRSAALAIGCLVLGIGGIGVYAYLVESWTCHYYAESRITGAELTPYAAEYLRQEPATTCEELLKRFTGRADEIWTRSSSLARELTLSALHLSILATLTMLALLATRLLLQRQRFSRVQRAAAAVGSNGTGRGAGERLLPLALELSRIVLSHETILRHAQTALRAPDLIEIPSPAHARSLWVAVLRRAEIEGVVPRLVDLVLDENPAADELRALVREWLPGDLTGPVAPHPR